MESIATTLLWLLALEFIGLISLPLTLSLFKNCADRGYPFSRTLGIISTAYLTWLMVSLHLLPFGAAAIAVSLIAVISISALCLYMRKAAIVGFLTEKKRSLIFTELFFITLFSLLAVIRAHCPDITFDPQQSGAEKLMDFSILNGLMHSRHFPLGDTWYAGRPLNYYYFGHMLFAHLAKLLDIKPCIAYNLAVVTVLSLFTLNVFSLLFNLTRRIAYAVPGSLMITCGGNLYTVVHALSRISLNDFNFWDSSRVIPHTITEFPYFSFILGDLHAHFSATLILTVALMLCYSKVLIPIKRYQTLLVYLPVEALIVGLSFFANAWECPTIVFLFVLTHLAVLWRYQHGAVWRNVSVTVLVTIVSYAGVIMLAGVSIYPFLDTLGSIPAGLNMVDQKSRTAFSDILIHFGIFLFPVIVYLICRLYLFQRRFARGYQHILVLLLLFAVSLFVGDYSVTLGTFLFLFLVIFSLIFNRDDKPETLYHHILLLIVSAIIFGCDAVYVDDRYTYPLQRYNTVFKFYYHAWTLLGIAAVYAVSSVTALQSASRTYSVRSWKAALAVLILCSCLYPILATVQRCQGFYPRPTLDGCRFLEQTLPGDHLAIRWLATAAPGRPVILEAASMDNAYTQSSRVASFTGFSTILGWVNHELNWGRDLDEVTARCHDIASLYSSSNTQERIQLLKKYGVRYVYLGSLERRIYGIETLGHLEKSLKKVYSGYNVDIFEVQE